MKVTQKNAGSIVWFVCIFISSSVCFSQSQNFIGKVVDENGRPLAAASVKIDETNIQLHTDQQGTYALTMYTREFDRITVRYSYLGRNTVTKVYDRLTSTQLPVVVLELTNLSLENIDIQAKVGAQSNSSLVIDREMIERYPSLSLNDLLNFLPNRKIAAPSVQGMQNLTLRGAFDARAGAARNVDEMNNAFGTAIIIDDMVLSNNANMQSRNPNVKGLSNANLSISNRYGVRGDNSAQSYSGESSFGGIDLRQIPTENIERLEVISGVAPVRYGDISDGAVILERQAGQTPAFLRIQSRDNATSYGISKGFRLSPTLGDLNVDFSYLNSYADNRDKLKQYRRVGGNAIWTLRYGNDDKWKQTFSATYNKVLDGVNKDPDDPESAAISFGSWNFNASSRLAYQPNGNFLKRVGLNLGIQNAHQVSYRESYYNDPYVLYTDTLGTGIVEGIYDQGQYTAIEHVDGRPLTLSARLEANATSIFAGLKHNLNFGATVDYSKNNGLGRLSDPSRPQKDISGYSERYYDFSLLHPTVNIGFYLEDRVHASLWNRPLQVTAGVRYDLQNGHPSFSPRTNISYVLSPHTTVGFAYGMAFKSPSLAHLYPGPTFRDILLLNAYNGRVNESTSRIFVERYDPTNDQLNAQFSQTFETTFRWRKNGHALSIHAFYKQNRRGINSVAVKNIRSLPQYSSTPVPGQKPQVEMTGFRKYMYDFSTLQNANDRNNYGVEMMYASPKIESIFTSFVMAGGITMAHSNDYYNTQKGYNDSGSDPKDIIVGIFRPFRDRNYLSNGRVGSVTHLSHLRLVIELTADFQFLNTRRLAESQYIPIGYYTRDLEYEAITLYDPENVNHRFLYDMRRLEVVDANATADLIFGNFHLNVAKEIGKSLRLSFNVYNFLDYQPRRRPAAGSSTTILTPNPPPSYGAQITYKF
ncbi:TonB-dependent receptor domain-containing protein [Sphingobacterium paludis]|uniref:Outer membrane receptor protein involved in Fe transport n=1 Tax=Sphingobacterium paludis TaxID=1476465 RepID=A0A4R7DBE5_9SPHI|nr:TonB-dependent receptor [Sphingobacterium paludis]TDS17601.1 outer membrane receptor protein involved in Fe transport [Sphingobacterium paludis]